MSLKSRMNILIVFLTLSCALQSQAMTESNLSILLTCKPASDLLDTEIEGVLTNTGSSTLEVTVISAPFPFEVELLNATGNDLLAKHRKPPTSRRTGATTQTFHLEPAEKRSFKITLRNYLASRGFPQEVEQAQQLRLLIAASTEGSSTFSVFRSKVAALR